MKTDDVVMFKFFHERDFANSGRGSSFLGVEVDFLESDCVASSSLFPFKYGRIRPMKLLVNCLS